MPAHHKLEAFLDEYVRAAGIAGEPKSLLFRSARPPPPNRVRCGRSRPPRGPASIPRSTTGFDAALMMRRAASLIAVCRDATGFCAACDPQVKRTHVQADNFWIGGIMELAQEFEEQRSNTQMLLPSPVILLLCQFLLPLCLYDVSPDVYAKASGYVGPPNKWPLPLPSIFELLVQTATIGLVWIASGMREGNRRAVLSLNPVDGGILTTLVIGGLIWLLTFPTSYLLKEIGHGFETIGPKPVMINEIDLVKAIFTINQCGINGRCPPARLILAAAADSTIDRTS
jgi:hypothetical protein